MSKLLFYLLLIITIINTYFLYYTYGFVKHMEGTSNAILTVIVLIAIGIFTTLALFSTNRATKKNFFRLSIVISVILVIVSLYTRAYDVFNDFTLWRWSQTILYSLILVSLIALANNLYKRLQELVLEKNNN